MGAKNSNYRHYRVVPGAINESMGWLQRLARRLEEGKISKGDYDEACMLFKRYRRRHNNYSFHVRSK